MRRFSLFAWPILLIIQFALITPAYAKIYYSKNEALELAFGKDAQVEMQSLFPDDAQLAQIQTLAKTKLESGMFTFYVGKKQDQVIGYAAIESATVRTKPETLMIVLNPAGEVQNITTLAFHEPPEYQPPERWFEKLYKRSLDDMDFNKGIDGISGATLSTRSAVASTRKIMAIYQVMIKAAAPQ